MQPSQSSSGNKNAESKRRQKQNNQLSQQNQNHQDKQNSSGSVAQYNQQAVDKLYTDYDLLLKVQDKELNSNQQINSGIGAGLSNFGALNSSASTTTTGAAILSANKLLQKQATIESANRDILMMSQGPSTQHQGKGKGNKQGASGTGGKKQQAQSYIESSNVTNASQQPGASQSAVDSLKQFELDALCKELEKKALDSDCDKVSEILEDLGAKIPRKNLNVALRAAIRGTNTQRLDDTLQCIDDLLRANANVNAEEAEQGRTPLMMACDKGYLEIVRRLLDQDALIDHRDQRKKTALFYAIEAQTQNTDVVRELLMRRANPNFQSINGQMPLILAAQRRYAKCIQVLLEHGADLRAQLDSQGNSALHIASEHTDLKSVQVILKHVKGGCKEGHFVSESDAQEFICAQNKQCEMALDSAQAKLDSLRGEWLDAQYQSAVDIHKLLTTEHNAAERRRNDVVKGLISQIDQQQHQQQMRQQQMLETEQNNNSRSNKDKERQAAVQAASQANTSQSASHSNAKGAANKDSKIGGKKNQTGSEVNQTKTNSGKGNKPQTPLSAVQDYSRSLTMQQQPASTTSQQNLQKNRRNSRSSSSSGQFLLRGGSQRSRHNTGSEIDDEEFKSCQDSLGNNEEDYDDEDCNDLDQDDECENEVENFDDVDFEVDSPAFAPVNQLGSKKSNKNSSQHIMTRQKYEQNQPFDNDEYDLEQELQYGDEDQNEEFTIISATTKNANKKGQNNRGGLQAQTQSQQSSLQRKGGSKSKDGVDIIKKTGKVTTSSAAGTNSAQQKTSQQQTNNNNAQSNRKQQSTSSAVHQASSSANITQSNTSQITMDNVQEATTSSATLKREGVTFTTQSSVQSSPQGPVDAAISTNELKNSATESGQYSQAKHAPSARQPNLSKLSSSQQEQQQQQYAMQNQQQQPGLNSPNNHFPDFQTNSPGGVVLMNNSNFQGLNYAPSGIFQSNAAPPQPPPFRAGVAPTPTTFSVQQSEQPFAPVVLNLDLTNEKMQTNFIMEQQDRQIADLKQQAAAYQMDRHAMGIQIQQLKQLQMESWHFCNAQYEQSQNYHNNFKLLENEYCRLQDSTKLILNEALAVIMKFKVKKDAPGQGGTTAANGSAQAQAYSQQMAQQLQGRKSQKEIEETINKVQTALTEINYSVEQRQLDEQQIHQAQPKDDTDIITSPCEDVEDQQVLDQPSPNAQVQNERELISAEIQLQKKREQQSNNSVIQMEQIFEPDAEQMMQSSRNQGLAQTFLLADQVYAKLNDDICQFMKDSRDILDEIQPVKNECIRGLAKVLQKSMPHVCLDVYGSHATQLCLHWSDIDLVVCPSPQPGQQNNQSHNQTQHSQHGGMHGSHHSRGGGHRGDDYKRGGYVPYEYRNKTNASNFDQNCIFNGRHLQLEHVYEELRRDEHRSWVQKVQFIENTAVPVIKLQCTPYGAATIQNGMEMPKFTDQEAAKCKQFENIPELNDLKYPDITLRPINVDISQMTDQHYGPQCVSLVKEYLGENQLIEPLIMVLKQMLKVWGFNDPYTGGLSSYALFLLIVSFLQAKQMPTEIGQVNLGRVLLEFMKYYSELDVKKYAIACSTPGAPNSRLNTYPIFELEPTFNSLFNTQIIIDDPMNPNNNVGKSAFRYQHIRCIFNLTYNNAFLGCSCQFKLPARVPQAITNGGFGYNDETVEQDDKLLNHSQIHDLNLSQQNAFISSCQHIMQPGVMSNRTLVANNSYSQMNAKMPQTQPYLMPYERQSLQNQSIYYPRESILAKIIYTYRQYQHAFDKSAKEDQIISEQRRKKDDQKGRIQPHIVPQPASSHLNEVQQHSANNWMQYLPNFMPPATDQPFGQGSGQSSVLGPTGQMQGNPGGQMNQGGFMGGQGFGGGMGQHNGQMGHQQSSGMMGGMPMGGAAAAQTLLQGLIGSINNSFKN